MEVSYLILDDMHRLRYGKAHGMRLKSILVTVLANYSGPLHATDAWNLGTLTYEIFNGAFSNSEQLNNKGVIPQVILKFDLADDRTSSLHINVF